MLKARINNTDFETVRVQAVNYTSLNLFLSIHFLAKKSTNRWDGTKLFSPYHV